MWQYVLRPGAPTVSTFLGLERTIRCTTRRGTEAPGCHRRPDGRPWAGPSTALPQLCPGAPTVSISLGLERTIRCTTRRGTEAPGCHRRQIGRASRRERV